MDHQSFRNYGHQFIDWLADYFENVEQYSVRSQVKPGEIKKKIAANPPEKSEQMDEIFQDFKDLIMPGITHWQHPGWFAYFPANNSPASVLGELLTAGIGAQCMIWQTSPAAAELEEVVTDWLKKMLGLPTSMVGVIQDTASTATLCALLSAREKVTNFSSNQNGLNDSITVYTSAEAHSSVEKAAKIAGYGSKNVRLISTDHNFAMISTELENTIKADLEKGLKPACVVGTIGTTSSTALDPLKAIGEICVKYDLWFHIDAAYGGTAAIVDEKKYILNGCEYADSFVVNPHKWMMTNFDCSVYFVRSEEALIKTFEIKPEYLKTKHDNSVKNYRDWGIQLGRRFRALKLWFVIRSYGISGLQQIIKEHLQLANLFEKWVINDNRFELLAPVNFSLVCFRYFKKGASEEQLQEFNSDLLELINSTGQVYLTHTSLKGKYTLRMAIGQRTTTEKNVQQVWDLLLKYTQELEQQQSYFAN